jgi:hypothetical protein
MLAGYAASKLMCAAGRGVPYHAARGGSSGKKGQPDLRDLEKRGKKGQPELRDLIAAQHRQV